MKLIKKWAAFLLISAVLMSIFTICVYASENEDVSSDKEASSAQVDSVSGIKTVNDLTGKRIGVQLGTTGAVYARDVENAASIVENRLTDLNKKTDELNESVIKLDNNNNLIINPKSEVESTAKNSLIGGIATVGKGEYTFGFGGNTQKVYVSGNASDGYQLQLNVTSSFDPTNYIRPLFESIYKNTYLLNANTYEKVAKITAVTPNTDG